MKKKSFIIQIPTLKRYHGIMQASGKLDTLDINDDNVDEDRTQNPFPHNFVCYSIFFITFTLPL